MKLGGWKKKRHVIRHYDRLASVYDALYMDEQNLKIKSALDAVPVSDSDLVLDVGCGTGFLFDHIGDSAGLLVGIDASLGLLKVAADRSKRSQKSFSVCLIHADADYMPFSKEIFDKVFAFTLLQDMVDLNTTMQEIMRVAKSDSTIVITGLKKSFSEEEFRSILREAGLEFYTGKTVSQAKDVIAVCCKTSKVKNK
jgi:malonyl-CoA O-methyltransferase